MSGSLFVGVLLSRFQGIWQMLRGKQSKKLGSICELFKIHLSDTEAHTADADAYVTALLTTAMIVEGWIPDDVEGAFEEQAAIEERLNQERARFGRAIFPDRRDGRLRLGIGKHCGTLVDEAEPGYLKWLLSRPDLTEETKGVLLKATGQTEQIGLFT